MSGHCEQCGETICVCASAQSRTSGGLAADLQVAFVQGAAWWEQRQTGGTMWQSDRCDAEAEAFAKACNGTLGNAAN